MEVLPSPESPKATDELRYTVVGDTHANYETVSRMIEAEDPHTDVFVFVGDYFDGINIKGASRLVKSFRQLDDEGRAKFVLGNHEIALMSALSVYGCRPKVESYISRGIMQRWGSMHQNVLESYGIKPNLYWPKNAELLREVMKSEGDLDWLMSIPPTFETGDFIVVHSGPKLDTPWTEQTNEIQAEFAGDAQRLIAHPDQIFSQKLACMTLIPDYVDTRTFVHGHRHYQPNYPDNERNASERLGRVWLGSKINQGEPLPIWRSQDDVVVLHDNYDFSRGLKLGSVAISQQNQTGRLAA